MLTLLGFIAYQPQITPSTTQQIVSAIVEDYGLTNQIERILRTIYGESQFNSGAVGDGGRSFGLWQINFLAHPEVSTICALSIYCSTDWAIQIWKLGHRMRCITWSKYSEYYCNYKRFSVK